MTDNILDHIDMRQLGKLLQQARQQQSMTSEEVAKLIEVPPATMTAIEKGDRPVKPAELIVLARAYGKSVSDFIRQRPVIKPFDIKFGSIYSDHEQVEEEIKPCICQLEELCQNYLELEQIMQSPLPRHYPLEYAVSGMPIETTAEAIANQERQRLGLGDSPIGLLRDILEMSVGLRIFYIPMPERYAEIYGYNDELGGCIGINANHPEELRRWSLAYGYLHFLTNRHQSICDLVNLQEQSKNLPKSEQLAESFAKYFFMPTSSLLKQFNGRCQANQGAKFTQTDLFSVAHYYGVSVMAMTFRLEEMQLLPAGTWDNLKERGLRIRHTQQDWHLRQLECNDLNPIYYQHLAIEALNQGLITEGQFAKFFQVDRLEARRIAELLREYSSDMDEQASNLDLRQNLNERELYAI